MPRLMSVSHTEPQVVDRSKTVTRRKGWTFLKPGDRLTLCRKVMGRQGAPLVRLAEVVVVHVHRGPLSEIHQDIADPAREGFPSWSPGEFIEFFCQTFGGDEDQAVTRIEWRYLDASPDGGG